MKNTLILPVLENGDRVTVRHIEPDESPAPPRGTTLLVEITSPWNFFGLKGSWANLDYTPQRVSTLYEEDEALQEAVNAVAENYWALKQARIDAEEMLRKAQLAVDPTPYAHRTIADYRISKPAWRERKDWEYLPRESPPQPVTQSPTVDQA